MAHRIPSDQATSLAAIVLIVAILLIITNAAQKLAALLGISPLTVAALGVLAMIAIAVGALAFLLCRLGRENHEEIG